MKIAISASTLAGLAIIATPTDVLVLGDTDGARAAVVARNGSEHVVRLRAAKLAHRKALGEDVCGIKDDQAASTASGKRCCGAVISDEYATCGRRCLERSDRPASPRC